MQNAGSGAGTSDNLQGCPEPPSSSATWRLRIWDALLANMCSRLPSPSSFSKSASEWGADDEETEDNTACRQAVLKGATCMQDVGLFTFCKQNQDKEARAGRGCWAVARARAVLL